MSLFCAFPKTMPSCLQVLHIFSHIHQTYIIDSITVEDVDEDHCTRPVRWVTETEFKEAAISTAMKKVGDKGPLYLYIWAHKTSFTLPLFIDAQKVSCHAFM